MPIQFNVLLLLDTAHGSLVEIELKQPDLPVGGKRRWLWIESHWVTSLEPVGAGTPFLHVFDGAVLTLGGDRGDLRWPSGRCDSLFRDPACALRPEFHRLVHQHLN